MTLSIPHDPRGPNRLSLEASKSRLDLRDIVARLSPGGNGDLWACPGHGRAPGQGGTPSLSIFSEGRRWKCHSCGAGGDALDFLAFAEGRPLADVIRDLREGGQGGATLPASPRPRGPVAPTKSARPRPPELDDVSGAWSRSLAFAKAAPSSDPGRVYLEERYARKGFARLLELEAVGLADPNDPARWVRSMAMRGFRVVLACHGAPRRGDVTSSCGPVTMNLRSARSDVPKGNRFRKPGGVPDGIAYGDISAEVGSAESGTLAILEGAGDLLRAKSKPRTSFAGVLAYVATGTARKLADAVRLEIEELRALGLGGPQCVVLFPHLDANGSGARAAADVVDVLANVVGLEIKRARFANGRVA